MKSRSGFTIIELIVTIAVIGILLAISTVTYTKQQVDARDDTRNTRATITAEALEKYYEQNGEYPPVPAIVSELGNSGTTVASKLKVAADTLILPGVSSTVTNSLSNASPTTTKLKYTASSIDPTENTACQSSTSGGCDAFTLTYKREADNSDVTITSRHNDRPALATLPPPPPVIIDAPSAPGMTTSYASNTITGTAATVTCNQGAAAKYAIASRTNDGTWGAYSAWSTTRTASLTTAQGTKYGFRAKAICQLGSDTSPESPVSAEATYIHPINTPAAPTVTASTSGNITTWSWNATVCPAGTTARYQYQYIADWGYNSPWYGPNTNLLSLTWDTSSQGYQYTIPIQTHCYTAFDTSDWSGTGQASYIRPVTAPGPISHSIARGAPNIVYVRATSSCHSSVALYSRADVHTWDYPWEDNGLYGWYASTHGNTWVLNSWNFYGSTVETGAINNQVNFNSGSRWNIATDMACRNMTTGRQSATTGRVESGVMYLP